MIKLSITNCQMCFIFIVTVCMCFVLSETYNYCYYEYWMYNEKCNFLSQDTFSSICIYLFMLIPMCLYICRNTQGSVYTNDDGT